MSCRLLSIRILIVLGICLSTSSARAQKMYWVEKGADVVGFADRDGTNAGSFAISAESASQSIAVDALNGHVYWSELGTDKVRRADLDGSNKQDILTGVDAFAIALDVYRKKIYWVTKDSVNNFNRVDRANLDGTSVENIVATSPAGFPPGIALDVKNDKVYWTEFFTHNVMRANLDGTQVETVVASSGNLFGIAVDTTNDKIYWGACLGDIRRADLNGANVETVVAAGGEFPCPGGLSLDVPNGKLYWADENGLIRRSNLDGTAIEDLIASGLSFPEAVVLDEPPELPAAIPAVDEWGLVMFVLLLCIAGTLALRRTLPLQRYGDPA